MDETTMTTDSERIEYLKGYAETLPAFEGKFVQSGVYEKLCLLFDEAYNSLPYGASCGAREMEVVKVAMLAIHHAWICTTFGKSNLRDVFARLFIAEQVKRKLKQE